MGSVIRHGHATLVAHTTLAGQEAVVKLYGPEPDGLKAYCAEFDAYRALEKLQGDIVPVMLAAGRACPVEEGDAFAIATRLVPGLTLEDVLYEHGSVGEQVGEAAMEALRRLHAAVPGFLHGDLVLDNVVLVEQEAGQPPRCVILGFGMARLDATPEEQAEEVLQLEVELDEQKQEDT